jgi:putative transcriptional regulator
VSAAVNALPPPVEKDSPPMTEQDLAKARRVPRVTTLRRALRMTQEQFSAEFKIPIGTLRDWEQGRVEPDATARAYLRAIAGNAEAVSKALITYRVPAAE